MTCPTSGVDPALLERVIANLAANALRYAPPGKPPLLTASTLGDRVELRVVDRGPGIPEADRDRVFAPFQRLGDSDNTTGVGLGLALSRGLTEAMGGTLEPEDTPGGGLTMVAVAARVPVRRPSRRPTDGRRAGRPRPRPTGRTGGEHWSSGRHAGVAPIGERGTVARDPRAGRRRRAADPPRAADQPAGARATRSPPRRTARRRSPRRPGTRRTSSSWTSACPTWTASR